MNALTNATRITELLELSAAEGLPLTLQPATICALEDIGILADPFSCQLWRDPDGPLTMTTWGVLCKTLPELLS